jgi:hypothetical protein
MLEERSLVELVDLADQEELVVLEVQLVLVALVVQEDLAAVAVAVVREHSPMVKVVMMAA